ncbi:hypothetical protein HNP29_002626 [Pseudomonas alcaligenes]|nr:hypothetical protein [Pseudomonas alcaligenes]
MRLRIFPSDIGEVVVNQKLGSLTAPSPLNRLALQQDLPAGHATDIGDRAIACVDECFYGV